jgi:Family of unknown function (DUF6326)
MCMKKVLDEQTVNVRIKLAALWASFMFLYIYVDYFHLYMPGALEDMLAGRVFEFDISQGFLIAALVSVSIPALMIFLSVGLPAKISRMANIVLGAFYIPYTLFNLVGEAWPHMYYGAAIEVALLVLIIRNARNWPMLKK